MLRRVRVPELDRIDEEAGGPSGERRLVVALAHALEEGVGFDMLDLDVDADVLEHGQTGLLCENSANDVAKSIDRLISDIKLRDKLAKNAKRYVANSHSQKTQIASLNSLYDQMLSEAS